MDSVVRRIGGRVRPARAAAVALLACSAGACGSMENALPDVSSFRLPDRSTFLPTQSSFNYAISPNAEVKPSDLVNAQGQCAAPAAQTASHSVSLDMTECEVVRALGQPQSVEFPSQGSGDQRHVVLTYRTGERPGVYEFRAGRLTGIDRGAGGDDAPPAAAKKPRRGAAADAVRSAS